MNTIEISSQRTVLRLINLTDVEAIHELHSLPETDRFNTLGIPENLADTQEIVAQWVTANQAENTTNYTFKIELNADHQFIGLFGLKLGNKKYRRGEVWYNIHSSYWNQGYATEVLAAMVDFGFDELGLHRIQAGCAVDNIGSIKVLEKVGMIREGRGREILPLKSGWSDNFEYSILESDERKQSTVQKQ